MDGDTEAGYGIKAKSKTARGGFVSFDKVTSADRRVLPGRPVPA